jgi:putative aldouronate transport system substrate-binding protein
LFKSGQLDKEFGVKNSAAAVETIVSGKVGLNYGAMYNPLSPFQDLKKKDPKSDWQSYPLPSIDGQPAKMIISGGVGTFHVVKKGAKHPEALVKMTNFFLEKGFGKSPQQEIYFRNNGIEVFGLAHFVTWPPKNLQIHLNIKKALETKDESKLNPEEKANLDLMKKFDATGDPEGWAYKGVFGPEGSFKTINDYKNKNLILYNEFYGLPTKTMTEKQATLDKMEIEMATQIIMGAPLDTFDKFVADWKRLGGDALTQEVNDWYKTQQ